ncbi:MAG: hypothetical protein H6887_02190 [Hoeflea sp.]|nr:hypothetical protein [Hoeflea sp.]
MFNLIANAMFEATRLPAPPARPVRSPWSFRGNHSPVPSSRKGEPAARTDTARGR